MERDSVMGHTPIPQSCGLSIKIEDMHENDWNVLSWSSEHNGVISSRQIEFLEKKYEHECIKLIFQDGRELECTLNHPLLTIDNDWILAKDIQINSTRIKTSINFPLCDFNIEMQECQGWSLDLKSLTLNTNSRHDFFKSMAFMRLLGLIITDGHIGKNANYGSIFLGHMMDVNICLEDIYLVYGKDSNIQAKLLDGTYCIRLPSYIIIDLKHIEGIVCGNKTEQEAIIPSFIFDKNFPLPLLREFLGGMFGGDGHTCYLGMHRGKRDILTSISFSRSTRNKNINALEKYMEDLSRLLNRFDIKNITIQKAKETTNSKSKENLTCDERTFSLVLHLSIEELIPFYEKIGFRYCLHKSIRLEAGVSYKRLRNNVVRQHNWIVNRVDELTNFSKIKKENPTKIVATKKAILQAVEDLKKIEPLFHEYAIPSTHDISDHLLHGTTFGKFRSTNFPTAHEYMQEIDAVDWFIFENSSKQGISYGIKRCDNFIPTMNLKILSIKPIGSHKVYDIEVEKTNSFLANGVVAHNCMISHGVSRFLTERLFDMSDVFSVPLCAQCGAMPHSHDICNVCDCTNIRRVLIPYACKLLFQELMAMGIKINLYPDEDKKYKTLPLN